MSYPRMHRFSLILAFGLAWAGATAHAEEARYRYVSLDNVTLPTGYDFFAANAIDDSGRVYGYICDDTCSITQLVSYKGSHLTVLATLPPASFSGPVNDRGTVGLGIVLDPVAFTSQAALFHHGKIDLVPPQPAEAYASTLALNNHDTALVESINASGQSTNVLYKAGVATPLDFGANVINPVFPNPGICHCLNDHGVIEGTEGPSQSSGARAFRFDTRSQAATILNPYPGDSTETLAWGEAINRRGDVLGYSFTSATSPYHERIGEWDRNGRFTTFYVESDINSNGLLFNDCNLIVITITGIGGPPPHNSYIVPRPGVRLNLADQVVNLPAGVDLAYVLDLNNHGDMLGGSSAGNQFLLQRLDGSDRKSYATPVLTGTPRVASPAIAAMRSRLFRTLAQAK